MGGGTPQASTAVAPRPDRSRGLRSTIPALSRHSSPSSFLSLAIPLPPSFLRAPFVIPAQAGTRAHRGHPAEPTPNSLPQFIPPPFQGGGEVGGGTPQASTAVAPRPGSLTSRPSPPFPPSLSSISLVIPLPPSFLRRQEPAHDQASPHPAFPAALERHLGSPSGYCGTSDAGVRVPACAGTTDWGVARLVRRFGASHPPPNLPPKRGEG